MKKQTSKKKKATPNKSGTTKRKYAAGTGLGRIKRTKKKKKAT